MSITLRIAIAGLTLLTGILIGLLLRHVLVRRLKSTVLDNWLIQTLGIVVVAIPILLSIPVAITVWDSSLLIALLSPVNLKTFLQTALNIALRLGGSLLLVSLGFGIARTLRTLAVRGLGQNRIDINTRVFFGRILYFLILIFAALWLLSFWGIPLTPLVTGLGVFTVALTVSIQDILKDLIAGFYILIERPFHIGDQISVTNGVASYTGQVEDVQVRATKMRLVSGEEMTIPNSMVFGNVVVNNTFYGERRVTITLTIPQEEFIKGETQSTVLKAVKGIERVSPKPEPTVTLTGFTNKDATLTLRFWIASGQHDVVAEVMHVLHDLLPNAEIVVKESGGDV